MLVKRKLQVHPKSLSLLVLGITLLFVGLCIFSALFSFKSWQALSAGQPNQARYLSKVAYPIVASLDLITLGVVPEISSWKYGLQIIQSAAELQIIFSSYTDSLAGSTEPSSISDADEHLSNISKQILNIKQEVSKSWLMKKIISQEQINQLDELQAYLPALIALTSQFNNDPDQKWVILLQNTDEIRATGGFAGSYAVASFEQGNLSELVIEDIYDADGQFTGFVSPPPGVKEYTSGDNGLRLPDANWWPDFPKSAQTMLQFFALGNRQDVSGIVALNLPVMKQVLEITGPVWLPDNNVEISSQNIHHLLRAERGEFFPGSHQKKHLLSHAQSMITQRIAQLSTAEKIEVASLLIKSFQNKNLQIYAVQPDLQRVLSQSNTSGTVGWIQFSDHPLVQDCGCQPKLIMQVESNVGINKVNSAITRQSRIEFLPNKTTVSTTFYNAAQLPQETALSSLVPAEQLSNFVTKNNQNGYINYHRLYVDPSYQVEKILINDQLVSNWDENIIKTSDETELKEIGVLVATPAQASTKFEASFSTPDGFPPPIVIIPKQSGLPASDFQIVTPQKEQLLLLDKDVLLQLR